MTNKLASYEFTAGTPGNYSVTTKDGKLTMTNASVAITITAASDSKTYDGSALTNSSVTVTKGELLPGDELVATATGSATNVADTAEGNNPIAEGYKVMHGTEDVTANYTITPVAGKLTINPKALEVTVKDATKEYTGSEQSGNTIPGTITADADLDAYKVSGLVSGDSISVTYTPAKGTNAATYDNATISVTAGNNYTVTATKGKLTIDPYSGTDPGGNARIKVTIKGKQNTADYDGKTHKVTGYDAVITNSSGLTYTVNDFTYDGTAVAERIDAGTEQMGLVQDQFRNTNGNFVNIVFELEEDGYQKINPLAVTVKINGHTVEAPYDGEEHIVKGYDVTISNKLYKETDFTFTPPADATIIDGEIGAKGTEPNTYMMGLAAGQFKNNNANFTVTFTVTDGSLAIRVFNEVVVYVSGQDETYTYDGGPHSTEYVTTYINEAGETVIGLPKGITLTEVEKRFDQVYDQVNVGNYTHTIVEDDFELGVPAGTRVTLVISRSAMRLTITPAPVTLTANSGTFTYDGTAHTVTGVTSSVPGLTFGAAATATGTDAGSYPVNVTGATVGARDGSGNYELVAINNGTLTIAPAVLTVTTGSAEKVYDGEALTEGTATIAGLVGGETATVAATGAQTDVGQSANTYAITWGSARPDNYTIAENLGTLTVTPVEEIDEPETPLARNTPISTWSLFDLICTLVSILAGIIMTVTFFKKKDDDEEDPNAEPVKAVNPEEEEEDEKKRKYGKFLGLLPAIAAIITFILTQDLSGKMVIFDKWSILFAAYVLLDAAMGYLTRNKKAEKEEETATV